MKTRTFALILIPLLALALAACASGGGLTTTPAETPRTISVNGTGAITLTPDMATIQIGVNTENASAERAVAQNNQQADAIRAALDGFGIAAEDIQTSNFSIYPRQDYDINGQITGVSYVVQNTVTVTIRDLENFGRVLDAVVQAGANNIYGISFDVADREAAYAQALEAAMQNARARAEILAAAGGVTLGEVQTVNAYVGGGGVVQPYAEVRALDAAGGAVPVAPGTLEITLDVQVTFEIK
ncbi:MAG: SIMPL domain-containing protein [Chloroflexi bacterium]|nr:SIMPL domain-containing protein [Chloroflexota bacterium]